MLARVTVTTVTSLLWLTVIGVPFSQAQNRDLCNLRNEKQDFLNRYQIFYDADKTLKRAAEDGFQSIPPTEFSYLKDRRGEIRERINTDFSDARKRFDEVINLIVAQKTKACFVCSLKPTYDSIVSEIREELTLGELDDRKIAGVLMDLTVAQNWLGHLKKVSENVEKDSKSSWLAKRRARNNVKAQETLVINTRELLGQSRKEHLAKKLDTPDLMEKMSKIKDSFDCK